ncbi:GFA family protein [Pendulispora rubella]|uniref:GFA family protein n=1 Tax=Pendulispora rubella TaxID=2741070 RepID=A0ABZ2L0E5_9BACT
MEPTDMQPESESPPPHTGRCLCGAIRYVANGSPVNVRVCHCRICQRATGAPFFARALFPIAAVSVQGQTSAFASSAGLLRRFCASCGTSVFAQRDHEFLAVALATLDEPGRLPPTMHIFTSSKVPWLSLNDGLPQFLERP